MSFVTFVLKKSMKKIVVTGGSGKLAQFVIRDLLDQGYSVLSLDRVAPREKLCMSWQVDLRHAGDLFEALRGAYGIIHLGAYQAPNLAPDAETLSNNVSATYNVLRARGGHGRETRRAGVEHGGLRVYLREQTLGAEIFTCG